MSLKRKEIIEQPISTIVDGWAQKDGSLNLTVKGKDGVYYAIIVKTKREPKS